jgi:ergothioneine biosynthesis protein EgtB
MLLARFQEVRALTVALCAPLTAEDQVLQSMPDASPAKWHLGHTTWFFETLVLAQAEQRHCRHDPRFAYLFNSYYNTLGERLPQAHRGLLSRPTLAEVHAYRAAVDERMALVLARPLPPDLAVLVTLGLNHEQQHQELLLTDIKHLFSLNPFPPAYAPPPTPRAHRRAALLEYRAFEGGLTGIGHIGGGFCFDNEEPRHRVFLEPFRLATRTVTNGELLEFVRDGGYSRPECWLADGWDHVRRHGWQRPLYWADSLDHEHTLHGKAELALQAPACHLSYYEADAFARWAGARLPTEVEWEHAARQGPCAGGHFLESGLLHPCVSTADGTHELTALLSMLGDVWEWTASAYTPYPGYRPAAGAIGEYNGKFMANQLVLRGGSCLTPGAHIRVSYRNFFRPDARWQMSGVRLADGARA